jgi:hypothetical protein
MGYFIVSMGGKSLLEEGIGDSSHADSGKAVN